MKYLNEIFHLLAVYYWLLVLNGLISNDDSLGQLMTVHSWVQSNFPIYFDLELGCGPVLDELHIKNVLCCLLRPQNSRHVCLSCPESQQQLDGHIYQSKSSRYPSFTCFYFVCLHWTVSLST